MKITLAELLLKKNNLSYTEQSDYICSLIDCGKIKPVKSSGTNGKKPALPNAYHIIEEKKDYSRLVNELRYEICSGISIDYYIKHPDIYEKERKWVLMLNEFLEKRHREDDELQKKFSAASLNERSFEIWNREKFLQKENGKRILSHCGLDMDALDIYTTSEPLAYYSKSRNIPQNILIIENKDTFYSMRKYLIENESKSDINSSNLTILGVKIDTLVYGAGKGILRSASDFEFCAEPYMNDKTNTYLYFGDLDYEGIGIYENLAGLLAGKQKLIPFVQAYEKMIEKAEICKELPETKEGQNRNITGYFETFFEEQYRIKIKQILVNNKYIPQEIINANDLV